MMPPEFSPEVTRFQWDVGNSEKSIRKHGITQKEAEQVFFNRPLAISEASAVDEGEQRYAAFGRTDAGKRTTVVFTIRGDLVRVISARPMSRRERSKYDQEEGY